MRSRSKFGFAAGAILATTLGFVCLAKAAPLAELAGGCSGRADNAGDIGFPKPCRKRHITIAATITVPTIAARIIIVTISIAAITERPTLFWKGPGVYTT